MDNSQTIARYIWHILTLNPYIPMSWGVDVDNIIATDDSLEFHVDGFLHTGNVRITYIEGTDLFQVCLYDSEGKLTETIDDVCFNQLTDLIDKKVEYTGENYGSRVIQTLLQPAV